MVEWVYKMREATKEVDMRMETIVGASQLTRSREQGRARTNQIQVRVNDEEYAYITNAAKAHNMTLTAFVLSSIIPPDETKGTTTYRVGDKKVSLTKEETKILLNQIISSLMEDK